jgi:hypothetical protein
MDKVFYDVWKILREGCTGDVLDARLCGRIHDLGGDDGGVSDG